MSRHDWIHHELQVHRREYVCKECDKRCPTRKEASTHLREHYGESTSPSQLNVILEISERQVDVLADKEQCLICGDELTLSALQAHLGTHMEDIALFVLPAMDEEEESGGSKVSVWVARLESRGSADDVKSDTGSFDFPISEDPGGYLQNPTEFAKILAGEEIGYDAKISSWETKSEHDDAEALTYEALKLHEKMLLDRTKKEGQEALGKIAAEKEKEEEEEAKLAPIKFTDAVGRKFNFPLHICQSWSVCSLFRLPRTS